MTTITLGFEVHQPYRVKEDFFWKQRMFRGVGEGFEGLFEHYFSNRNKEIFEKVARKCYYPTNQILLENIDFYKNDSRKFKCAFSISGILLEQCERYDPDLLESFKQLLDSGCVEFLDQTYHHSLFSLYDDPALFIEDVKKHNEAMKDFFRCSPKVFENTEFLYNNRIASVVEEMGYKCIFTEGLERLTGGAHPNQVYRAKEGKLKVLLRNYKLTDDIGFRFSSQDWEGYPLTAEKYASWLAATPGDCINIFMDYETFGEHHWKETGIFDFLSFFPGEVLKWDHLDFATPSEVIKRYPVKGVVDAYEMGGTVSWADLERDTSCWLGNSMQWAAYTYHKQIRPRIVDADSQRIWGYLAASDHLYYMFMAGGGPGEVHNYFSPFEDPKNAFLNYLAVLFDFDSRIKSGIEAASHPFVFSNKGGDVLAVAFGKRDFSEIIGTVDLDSLKFHLLRGDFEKWVETSLNDPALAKEIGMIRSKGLGKRGIRKRLRELFDKNMDKT
ncbi:glycosyl hydrolase family 57 [archaeon BMS3Abin16]|nr:glycosyl hydrolase family 57 [archaeon BMS3Abin16]